MTDTGCRLCHATREHCDALIRFNGAAARCCGECSHRPPFVPKPYRDPFTGALIPVGPRQPPADPETTRRGQSPGREPNGRGRPEPGRSGSLTRPYDPETED